MANGPFYALLGYMIIKDGGKYFLTRGGFRTLTEKRPVTPKQKDSKSPEAGEQRREFPGDGYRPQQLSRTG